MTLLWYSCDEFLQNNSLCLNSTVAYNVVPHINFNFCNIGKFYEGQFRFLKCDHIIANHPGFARILAGIRVFSRAPGKYLPAPGISRALPDQYIGGRSGSNPRHNIWIHSYLTSSLATHTCIACVPSNTRACKTHPLIPMYVHMNVS